MAGLCDPPLTSVPAVSVVSTVGDISVSLSGTVDWSCFGVVGGEGGSLSSSTCSADWGLKETGSKVGAVSALETSSDIGMGVEVTLGQG